MNVGATLLAFIFIGGYFVWKCINDWGDIMEAIIFLIIFIAAYRMLESKKEDKMSSDQRFKHEWKKIK